MDIFGARFLFPFFGCSFRVFFYRSRAAKHGTTRHGAVSWRCALPGTEMPCMVLVLPCAYLCKRAQFEQDKTLNLDSEKDHPTLKKGCLCACVLCFCAGVHMYTYTQAHIHAYIHIHPYIYMHMYLYSTVPANIFIYIYIYTHTYTYTYMHAYLYSTVPADSTLIHSHNSECTSYTVSLPVPLEPSDCLYVHMYVYMYACMYVFACFLEPSDCLYVHMYVYMYACMYVFACFFFLRMRLNVARQNT
jgi:hypothetical protein